MKFLLIETSTEEGLSVFGRDREIIFQSALPKGFLHSRYLFTEIERGLKETNLSIGALSFIAVGTGPGSYTGLRVGVMAAKAFSFAAKVPLVSISALEGIAPNGDGPFIAALDARISGAYVLFGEKKDGIVRYFDSPKVQSLENLSQLIHGPVTIASPHADSLEKKWKDLKLNGAVQFVELGLDSQSLVKAACDRFQKGVLINDRTIEIQYLKNWNC